MSATKLKTERLDCRILPEHKRLLERAAEKSGLRVTDFVVSSSVIAAREILQSEETIRLSREDWDRFLAILEDDSPPNQRLAEAMERFSRGTFEEGRYRS